MCTNNKILITIEKTSCKMLSRTIFSQKYKLVVNRKITPLGTSLYIMRGTCSPNKFLRKLYINRSRIYIDGEIYYLKTDFLWEKKYTLNKLNTLLQRLIKLFEDSYKYAKRRYEERDINAYIDANQNKISIMMYILPILNTIIEPQVTIIALESMDEKTLHAVSYPNPERPVLDEVLMRNELYKIKNLPKKEALEFAERHILRFRHIYSEWLYNELPQPQDIIKNARLLKEETKDKEESISEDISNIDKKLLRLIQDAVWFRTYRMNRIQETLWMTYDLLSEEYGKDVKWNFLEYAINNKKRIIKRYSLISELHGECEELHVKWCNGVIHHTIERKEESKPAKGNIIKGNVAYKGKKIQGHARIITNLEDISKIKKGNILVTTMTKPEMMPAIIKASAIITDEGGITSHAAIVSRELKKPCIIGTKIATKVLRDGDVVEVDAERGVVKILERAKDK